MYEPSYAWIQCKTDHLINICFPWNQLRKIREYVKCVIVNMEHYHMAKCVMEGERREQNVLRE